MNALDPSVIMQGQPVQLQNPLALAAQAAQLQGFQGQNALTQAKLAEHQNSLARENQLRAVLAGADPSTAGNALLKGGFLKEAGDYQKTQMDARKGASEAQKMDLDTAIKANGLIGSSAKALLDDPNLNYETVAAEYQRLKSIVPPGVPVGDISQIPRDITQLRARLQQAFTQSIEADKLLSDARSGSNNAATNERMVTEGALNRGVTMRGQNMTDARARELATSTMTKPFELTDPATGLPVVVQQDKTGNVSRLEGYAPKSTAAKLSDKVVKQLTEARGNAATIDRLTASFKPEFAGKGVFGLGAEASLSAKSNLGMDKEAVEWWKEYRKQAELVERHSLFGASLTQNEQGSWRSADIGPGMDPAVIQRNLATRVALANKVFENTQQDLIDAGHNRQRINAIGGRDMTVPSNSPKKIASDADYNSLPSGAEFIAPDGSHRRKP